MDSKKISNSTTIFTFDNIENCLTNVFLIKKPSRIFIIDTFCGPDSMRPILQPIKNSEAEKEVIVINTHFHWDHVWGNCCFKKSHIISHRLCRKLLDELWNKQIEENKKYMLGKVEKMLPNITFNEKVMFEEDGIEIFYSPGHTEDSISVFDHDEKILYAGDNLEKPLIYFEGDNIQRYIETIENYLKYDFKKVVAGHTENLTKEDMYNTIQYLKDLSKNKELNFPSEYEKNIHRKNLERANANRS